MYMNIFVFDCKYILFLILCFIMFYYVLYMILTFLFTLIMFNILLNLFEKSKLIEIEMNNKLDNGTE
jgi:hypothetical protein